VPPEQRALALDAIDAVLAQALPSTAAATRRRTAVRAQAPIGQSARRCADAVRLLTVHGARASGALCSLPTLIPSGVDRDDDVARRLAGRGRASAALRVRVFGVALSATLAALSLPMWRRAKR
jgi:hypothetical protein